MKKNNIIMVAFALLMFSCSTFMGYFYGQCKTIENAKISYEERGNTRWCYLNLDQKAYAYNCTKDGGITK